jgi:thymidylate synthase ThyX
MVSEKIKASAKRYYEKNKEIIAEKRRKDRQNPEWYEKRKAQMRDYYYKNLSKFRKKSKKNLAIKNVNL